MVHFCAVYGCTNKVGTFTGSFFRFPAINKRYKAETVKLLERRREAWIAALKRDDFTKDKCTYSRICSEHFITRKPANLTEEEHPDWIPCLKMGYGKGAKPLDLNRYNRASKRSWKEMYIDTDAESTPHQAEDVIHEPVTGEINAQDATVVDVEIHAVENMFSSVDTQTDNSYEMLQGELAAANLEKYQLREKLKAFTFSVDSFKDNPEKVSFYTGLPNINVLLVVFNDISNFLNVTATSTLDQFQQFLLTLMKLRLNLSFTDLGYRFNVSRHTASRVFHSTLHIMYVRLKLFIMWPEREQLHKTMPVSFVKAFGKCVTIIIDCFEIFIEKPSNVMAHCQTWSFYKHHHTVKYLMGIAPQGVISFISEGWGGRCSDKHVTNESGILDKLVPGDVVLADRGFNITDEVGFHCATINIPTFTKGKKQLSPKDVESTRKIASVRIHVERVIGLIRSKYQILSSVITS